MVVNSITSRTAAALPLMGILLALANWNARSDAAWAWAAAIAMFVVMVIALYGAQRAVRRSSGDAASIRNVASVTGAVVFGALMMVIPLAVALAHAYGVVDDPDSGRRATMIIFGAYLVAFGNSLPRMLPPVSSMQCSSARVQAFQRQSGWTWVLCGLGFTTAWLALPLEAAANVSLALMAAAMLVTIGQLLRLRRPRKHARA
jgi:Ca2+/Na+ antiporter